eukprot:m.582420 g.582420  ORF g.582420 m.582420 type:complete len:100 (+) comp22337_c1_seq6:1361-1660(+)
MQLSRATVWSDTRRIHADTPGHVCVCARVCVCACVCVHTTHLRSYVFVVTATAHIVPASSRTYRCIMWTSTNPLHPVHYKPNKPVLSSRTAFQRLHADT